jgi:hypothetical protein
MGVRLFLAVHGHIADSVGDHEPGQVQARLGCSRPAAGSEWFTEPLDPLSRSSHAPRRGLAGHERSPVIAGCSPRISCRIRRRVRRPGRRRGDQHELPGAAPAGAPVVHTVTSSGEWRARRPGRRGLRWLGRDQSGRSPLTSDGPDVYLRRTWHVPRRPVQATAEVKSERHLHSPGHAVNAGGSTPGTTETSTASA